MLLGAYTTANFHSHAQPLRQTFVQIIANVGLSKACLQTWRTLPNQMNLIYQRIFKPSAFYMHTMTLPHQSDLCATLHASLYKYQNPHVLIYKRQFMLFLMHKADW